MKLLLVLGVFCLGSFGAPQAEVCTTPEGDGCKKCGGRGVVDCENHDDDLRALEGEVYCSVNAACPDCGGALVVDCEFCDGGSETAAMLARRKELREWAAIEHEAETLLGRKLMRIGSPHLELVGEIAELERGRKKVDGHHFLHDLARKGEEVARLVDEHYGVKREEAYKALMRLWFWQEPDVHKEVMEKVLLSASTGDYKLLGKDPIFSVCTSDPIFKDDYDTLLSLGVHNEAHMLLSNMDLELWIGLEGAGWFDAGAAHWYEEKALGLHRHYCVDEAHGPWKWKEYAWRSTTRKLLEDEEEPFLPILFGQQTGELPDWGHGLSWSLYDWMVATKPEALHPILMGLKRKVPARELLLEFLGMGTFEVETAWRKWVRETYPKREKRKRGR